MSGLRGVGGDAHNVQLPMLQHALRPQRSACTHRAVRGLSLGRLLRYIYRYVVDQIDP